MKSTRKSTRLTRHTKFKQFAKKLALGSALMLSAVHAHAGEGLFGWIYTADVQPRGKYEFEQKAWLQNGQSQGKYSSWHFMTEVEYGVTENYQVAGYINTARVVAERNGVHGETGGPDADLPMDFDTSQRYSETRFDSVAIENIYRVKNPYTDPFGLALYLEAEVGPHMRELETRLILQKNFLDDRLVVASNIMLASEREEMSGMIERASMLDTTLGFSYRVANNWYAGLEYRNHREFLGYYFNDPEHSAHFLGPNIHYATKDWWITAAWRHQMPWVKTFSDDQREVTVNDRIYGDEHTKNEFMLTIGIPFSI